MKSAVPVFLGIGLFSFMLDGCAASPDASLSVLIEREDAIASGLEPGADVENIQDGWSVRFDEFVVSLGSVKLTRGSENRSAGGDGLVGDLAAVANNEEDWLNIDGLAAARYDFGYSLVLPNSEAELRDVNPTTAKTMVKNGYSVLVRGVLEKTDGVSCPPADLVAKDATSVSSNSRDVPCYANPRIAFEVALTKAIRLGPCELDGIPGVGLASGASKSVAITFHGDHLFFNGFPEGEEASVLRLAQWLADSDLNLDGSVSADELSAIQPSDLSEIDERYSLERAPIAIASMKDYAEAQLISQGHFQGEGECPVALLESR